MNGIPTAIFIVISAFTMNLTLQCALGIKGVSESKYYSLRTILIKLGVIFFSVVLIWLISVKIVFSILNGIFVYILIFPVSYMIYEALEYLVNAYLLKINEDDKECFVSFPGGVTAAAAFICINIADNFPQAVVLSFGFVLGILIVIFIIMEIRNRAALEAVPVFIRGKPLVLITMSLLSLVFSTLSLTLLRIINIRKKKKKYN
jgi:Na+-translocating ferredoxin:NAD+ oxidoreductase RnfA subunit